MNKNGTDAISPRELILDTEVNADYYQRVRVEATSRGDAVAELESLLGEVKGNAVREATLLDLLGRRQEAREILQRKKDDCWAVYLHARMLLEEGRSADALAVLEEGSRKHDDTAALRPLLVEARAQTGDLEGSVKLLEALEVDAESPVSHYLHGLLDEKNGNYLHALRRYESAAEGAPEEVRYQFRLGYLHALHGDEERAITAYEMCQRTAPVYVRAMINLGILYEDAERYEDAITCYRMVLQSNPDHERAKMYLDDAEASLDMYYDKEMEKERSRRNQLLQIPVTDFELSVRSRNCLAKMNIHTLGDLSKKSEAELLSYKNFGETSLAEIKRILTQKGFRLGEGLDEERQTSEQLPDTEQTRILAEPVSVLELSSRSQRCMDRLGIESVGQLLSKSELDLISQKNFGVTSLNEVKRKLKERGLSLASG
ncbi:MAG: DNA-directed RNA polymerase subunit alpha C-terminal domain-containing protein [Planctomycetota bacterium]